MSLTEDRGSYIWMVKQLLTRDAKTRAQSALTSSPIYVLREVHVERAGESLLLSGRVDTFYHKQLAQEVVRAVADEFEVINSILVQEEPAAV
jgi:hypothetical protein